MLTTIISGGQTGADLGGLIAGNRTRIKTGGWAPKGFRIEFGFNPRLGSVYGLKETNSGSYPPRTKRNITISDATLWVGHKDSRGAMLTLNTCKDLKRPTMKVPFDRTENIGNVKKTAKRLVKWIKKNRIKILNVAGNRESTNCGIEGFTRDVVQLAIFEMRYPGYIKAAKLAQETTRDRARKRKARLQSKQSDAKMKRKRQRRRLPKNIETRFK